MKTITIKLTENDYKKLQNRAKKMLSQDDVGDYLLECEWRYFDLSR